MPEYITNESQNRSTPKYKRTETVTGGTQTAAAAKAKEVLEEEEVPGIEMTEETEMCRPPTSENGTPSFTIMAPVVTSTQ